MRVGICLISLLMFGRILAQTNFYARPTLDYKYSVSSTNNYGKFDRLGFSDKFAKNPYFSLNNHVFSPTIGLQIGCLIGVKITDKRMLEIGWSLDGAGSKVNANYLFKFQNNQSYVNANNSFTHSIITQRFSLQYFGLLSKISTPNMHVFFNFGMGILFNPNAFNEKKGTGGSIEIFESFGDSLSRSYLDSNIYFKSIKHIASSAKRKSLALNIGLSTDFYSDNKKYLLSASVFYVRSFSTMANFTHEYVINDNGVDKKFYYGTSSNGSGIYFQLSRRIQFKTWKDKLKKNELGLPQL